MLIKEIVGPLLTATYQQFRTKFYILIFMPSYIYQFSIHSSIFETTPPHTHTPGKIWWLCLSCFIYFCYNRVEDDRHVGGIVVDWSTRSCLMLNMFWILVLTGRKNETGAGIIVGRWQKQVEDLNITDWLMLCVWLRAYTHTHTHWESVLNHTIYIKPKTVRCTNNN